MKAVLFVFDRLAGAIERLGIDYGRFRAILAVKLALDRRRQHGWVQGTRRLTPLTWSLIIHGVMGLFVAAMSSVVASPLTALTVSLSVVMLMLTFDLVADYSSLLFDSTEGAVLAARPVAPRTVLAARLAHVAIYLGMYVGALTAATCVAGSLRWGVAFLPAYLFSLIAAVVLVLAAVTIVYLTIMRRVSRERARDAILYAQLVMTALTAGGYYLASTINMSAGFAIEERAWIYLYPPAWMAGLPALAIGRTDRLAIILAAIGLVAPAVVGLIAIRLAPGFRVGGADEVTRKRVRSARSGRVTSHLAQWATRSKAARAVFELVWILVARDRQFKTRTYPALLSIVLFVVAFGFLARSGVWADKLGEMGHTNMHLFLLYYGILVIPTPILMAPYSDHPEAAWIYRGMPIDRPGTVLIAALNVLFIRLVLPVFAAIAAVVFAVWGGRVIIDVALAFAVTRLVTFCFAMVAGRRLPFSAPPPGGASGTTAGAVIGGMALVLALGAVHRLLINLEAPVAQPWPVVVAIPIVLALAHLAARACAATQWSDV